MGCRLRFGLVPGLISDAGRVAFRHGVMVACIMVATTNREAVPRGAPPSSNVRGVKVAAVLWMN